MRLRVLFAIFNKKNIRSAFFENNFVYLQSVT